MYSARERTEATLKKEKKCKSYLSLKNEGEFRAKKNQSREKHMT